jgi:predicted nucleic acid-binding protein
VIAVIDDAAGRRTAQQLGIKVIGFAGLLLIAKKRGLIQSVSPLLISARQEGYWLSDELLKAVKSLANE